MHSAGFSFLKYRTRQSGQAKHVVCCFFPVFTAFIYTLSNDLKIDFMGTKGTTQSYIATANTYSQWDQNSCTCFFLIIRMYELTRSKKPNWKKIVLFNFLYFFLVSFRMQTAAFQFIMRNLPWKGGQPRIHSPACFTAPPTLLLLLFQSFRTGIMPRFISKTAALAECGAKPTKDSGNLYTDFSDLRIKCSKISALRASRETLEEYSSLLKKMEKLQICIPPPPFFFKHRVCPC